VAQVLDNHVPSECVQVFLIESENLSERNPRL